MEHEKLNTEKTANRDLGAFRSRYLFIYVDGEYKFIQYVEANSQEEAEQKVHFKGWIRVVELVKDMQIVYNGR